MTGARVIGAFGLTGAAAIAGVTEATVCGWREVPARYVGAFRLAGWVLGRVV